MDLQEWLKANFDEEQQKLMAPVLANEKVATKLKESVMMRSDYSQKQDALAKKEKELQANIDAEGAKNRAYQQDMLTWKAGAEKEYAKSNEKLEKLSNKLAAVKSRVETLKATYSIEDDDVKDIMSDDGVEVTPVRQQASNELDARYLTKEDFNKEVDMVKKFPYIPAIIHDLSTRHRELFNSNLSAQDLVEGAAKEGKSMEQYWNEKYKVADRVKEMEEGRIQDRIKKARDEERTKVLSEIHTPGARSSEPSPSPILNQFKPKDAPTGLPSAVDKQRGWRNAVAAYREHKYAADKSE